MAIDGRIFSSSPEWKQVSLGGGAYKFWGKWFQVKAIEQLNDPEGYRVLGSTMTLPGQSTRVISGFGSNSISAYPGNLGSNYSILKRIVVRMQFDDIWTGEIDDIPANYEVSPSEQERLRIRYATSAERGQRFLDTIEWQGIGRTMTQGLSADIEILVDAPFRRATFNQDDRDPFNETTIPTYRGMLNPEYNIQNDGSYDLVRQHVNKLYNVKPCFQDSIMQVKGQQYSTWIINPDNTEFNEVFSPDSWMIAELVAPIAIKVDSAQSTLDNNRWALQIDVSGYTATEYSDLIPYL